MWISPNHPSPPPAPAPPKAPGRALAAIPRGDGSAELRISLEEFKGHPYVAVGVWERGRRGGWTQAKGKRLSVRLGEVATVIQALQQVLAITGKNDAASPVPGTLGSRPRPGPQNKRQHVTAARAEPKGLAGPESRGGLAKPAESKPTFIDRSPPDRMDWRIVGLTPSRGVAGFDEFAA
jgi:hypothetical protein